MTGCSLKKTTRRVLTRRGVLWLGQTCNQRCYFCYFANRIADAHHPHHPFMSIEKAKAMCRILRNTYGDTAVDIQGGEPTIYPPIVELIRYCRDIGLYPTLITNGLVLGKPGVLEQYRDAGIRDFLVSLHGIDAIHDEVVGTPGAYERITAAIERMREVGIPFRYNCTMSKPVVPIIPEIARKAIEYGAYAVNYIAFNPFGDQDQGLRTRENVAHYRDIQPLLTEAIDMLEAAGIEANVRYLPLCMAEPRHRKNFYNYQQLSYDTHEWNYESWLWTMMEPQIVRDSALMPPFRIGLGSRRIHNIDATPELERLCRWPRSLRLAFALQRAVSAVACSLRGGKEYMWREEARVRAAGDCRYGYHEACKGCALNRICDGFHGDYAGFFGTDEARPVTDVEPIDDPKYYIRTQEKFVEPEDETWAL